MKRKMLTIQEAIELLKKEGSRLAAPVAVEGMPPMTFDCTLTVDGATASEIDRVSTSCPADLNEYWRTVRSSRLFGDTQYGQWGVGY